MFPIFYQNLKQSQPAQYRTLRTHTTMSVRYFRNVEICVGFGHTSQKSVMSLTIMITLSLISARYLPQELTERKKR